MEIVSTGRYKAARDGGSVKVSREQIRPAGGWCNKNTVGSVKHLRRSGEEPLGGTMRDLSVGTQRPIKKRQIFVKNHKLLQSPVGDSERFANAHRQKSFCS